MVSDDTEHACLTAQALLRSHRELEPFARALAGELRGWLLGLPAGIGFATLRALLKSCVGISPHHSGVPSAGNGPAMRAPVLGAAVENVADLRSLVRISTRLTHADPRAEEGAYAIACAAFAGVRNGPVSAPADFLTDLLAPIADNDLRSKLEAVLAHLQRGATPNEYAEEMGWTTGISGFINHTVPAALYCWLRYPHDFRAAVESAILLGGDTDTVGAIVGGLAGATLGADAIPEEWLAGLWEWPRTTTWMRKLGGQLACNGGPVPCAWPVIPLRNLIFTTTVLMHGLRRLLPPY
ncbi:MAG: ADP-ribosyl-(dinitrogen reductase) glycohydrolase [bacterium ADurb.Bin429]|nr:MAG: ADP-ribosyl-(dinitrogen reductase) glycohydrolase [bacterium ADurb.Bin429]